MKTVLITGGAGFIGSTLAQRLDPKRHSIYAFDNLHPQVHRQDGWPERLPGSVTLLPGDVTHAPDWDAVLKLVKPDTVVHLAAETGTGQSLTEATRHSNVNVVGTAQMIDAFTRHQHKPEHIILASSRAVYGEGGWQGPDGEIFYPQPRSHDDLEHKRWDFVDAQGEQAAPVASHAGQTTPNPSNVYAATKLAQEHILSAWTTAMNVDLSILRLQNVYGPGQSLQNSYTGIVALFMHLASQGRQIEIYEDGNVIRDFVYIEDVVTALEQSMERRPSSGKRLLDVGLGERITVLELAQHIAKLFEAPEPIITGAYRDGDVRAAQCDMAPTIAELGFTPEWSVEKGLQALAVWVRGQTA